MAYALPAEVDFGNLVAVREAGKQHIDATTGHTGAVEFDLGGLTEASSAVVALLIAWFRYGHAHGKVVRFLHVPVAIMNIIEVSDLTDVLPIVAPAQEVAVSPREAV
jgi:ABC-type transporter Mla MlaB component